MVSSRAISAKATLQASTEWPEATVRFRCLALLQPVSAKAIETRRPPSLLDTWFGLSFGSLGRGLLTSPAKESVSRGEAGEEIPRGVSESPVALDSNKVVVNQTSCPWLSWAVGQTKGMPNREPAGSTARTPQSIDCIRVRMLIERSFGRDFCYGERADRDMIFSCRLRSFAISLAHFI